MKMRLTWKYVKRIAKTKLHNFNNRIYWEKYYRKHRDMLEPSFFALYCYEKYCKNTKNAKLLELGCGNGRDSLYFMNKGIDVTALDLAREQLRYLSKKYKSKSIIFKCLDFCEYESKEQFDFVYSRFTLHAITEEQETSALENSFKNLKNGGLFFIEVRSIKDEMYAKSSKISSTEGKTDHYRRFAIYENLLEKMKSYDFEIVESQEAQGLAKYKDEDPFIIRIVAKRI